MKIKEFDELFLRILQKHQEYAINSTIESTGIIFDISSQYIDNDLFNVLNEFKELYFEDNSAAQEMSNQVNDDIDSLIDVMQNNLANDKDIDHNIDHVDQEANKRLGLSGLQKKLEGLISIDEGIKSKIVPAMSSIQFEDAARQRLEHIYLGLKELVYLEHHPEQYSETEVLQKIENSLSSVGETISFYEKVLEKDPPEAPVVSDDDFLF